MLRYERHELLNKSVTSIFGHFTQLPYLIAFTEQLNKGQAWNNEIYAFDWNGEKIQLDVQATHLHHQQHDYMIWSLVDVKDLELRQFNKNADKAIRSGLMECKHYKNCLLIQTLVNICYLVLLAMEFIVLIIKGYAPLLIQSVPECLG